MHIPNATMNNVEYDATKNPVTAVTVFQADRAEVRETILAYFRRCPVDVSLDQKNYRG